ncbi:MAG TPA: hypothetical protein VM512_17170 [Burkholderiaceae bacterium]|jgi:hypothetical protein|nr:hypothetical protein [Burkholderiaceae bacterium]
MTELSLVRLTLDYGLEGISYTRGNTRPTLPRDRDLRPSGVGRRPQLEALLEMPNLDSYLRDALMPSLNHPELLSRVQFERTLDRLYEGLCQLIENVAEREEESRGSGGSGGDDDGSNQGSSDRQNAGNGDDGDGNSDVRAEADHTVGKAEGRGNGSSDGNARQSPGQRDLRQACEALQRERALRADVWNYLNALHQG